MADTIRSIRKVVLDPPYHQAEPASRTKPCYQQALVRQPDSANTGGTLVLDETALTLLAGYFRVPTSTGVQQAPRMPFQRPAALAAPGPSKPTCSRSGRHPGCATSSPPAFELNP